MSEVCNESGTSNRDAAESSVHKFDIQPFWFPGHRTRSLVTVMVLLVASFTPLFIASDNASAYAWHLPILIEGNAQFTPANGVTGGTGVPGDPYIISGWSINSSTANGIEIRNTTASFIIRGVYIYCDVIPTSGDGVVLYNLSDGAVELSLFEDYMIHAIYAEECTNCSFTNNTFQRRVSAAGMPQTGVYLYKSQETLISRNNFTWTGTPVLAYYSPHTTATYNDIAHASTGMQLSSYSNDSIASHNVLSGISSYGIATGSVDNVTVSENRITSGTHVYIGAYGASSNITILDNNLSGGVYGIYTQNARDLNISSNNVDNFTDFGICIDRTENVSVFGNVVHSNGITLMGQNADQYGTHTIGTDNLVNGKPTVYVRGESWQEIDGEDIGQLIIVTSNNISAANLDLGNTDVGLQVAYSNDITVEECVLAPSAMYAALLYHVDDIVLRKCNMSYSEYGIFGNYIDNATIAYNEISYNSIRGLGISGVTNSAFTSNRITNNTWEGIYYQGAWTPVNTEIAYNEFSNNLRGIYLSHAPGVRTHHNNFLSNSVQVLDDLGASNFWNETYPSGGNYWSDYAGVDQFSGPNQDVQGGDGIGDTPYAIDGDSTDYYPLMNSVTLNLRPDARLSVSPSVGNASTTFVFDASNSSDDRDPLSDLVFRWDWTDDGNWDTSWSSENVVSHQYSTDGVKTARVEVRDTAGLTNNTTAQAIVDGAPPDTSHKLEGVIGDGGWYRSDVVVSLKAQDNLSGVASTLYRIDSADWQTYNGSVTVSDDGAHEFTYYSVDEAGNNENLTILSIDLDKVAGTLLAVYPADGSIVRNATPVISVFFDDSTASSGLNVNSISFTIDAANVTETLTISDGFISFSPTTPLDDGWHQLTAYVEDFAGNPSVLGVGFIVNTSVYDDHSTINETLSDLEERINQTLEQIESLLADLMDNITALATELEALESLISSLNQATDDLDALVSEIQNMTTATTEAIEALQDELESLTDLIEETQEQISDLSELVEDLQADLDFAVDRISLLWQTLNETQTSLDELGDQLEETDDSLSSDISSLERMLLIALAAIIILVFLTAVGLAIMIRRGPRSEQGPPPEEPPPLD